MSILTKLKDIAARDQATLLLPEDSDVNVTRNMSINCKCICGTVFEKNAYTALKGSLYCRPCTRKKTKEKYEQTCIQRYGVPYPTQSPEIMAKRKPVDNIEEIKLKRMQTSIARYGTLFPIQCKEVLEKRQQTMIERYGISAPNFNIPEIAQKIRETCLAKYGTETPSQCPEVIEKRKKTLRKKKIERLKNQLENLMKECE